MVTISRSAEKIEATINLTASKSISNRLLIISALSEKEIAIENLSTSTDTKVLQHSLHNLSSGNIDAADAGTAFRFLTAFLAITEGRFVLTGTERMKKRPIAPLVSALQSAGADIDYLESAGFPPLLIQGKKLTGGPITIDGSLSSQYISALMLIAPTLEKGLHIHLQGNCKSWPYIEMTAALMEEFGASVKISAKEIIILPGKYSAINIKVENDWSAASYWFEFVALNKDAHIILTGLSERSIQGDAVIRRIMDDLGVESTFINGALHLVNKEVLVKEFSFDFSNCPDLTMTVAAVCAIKKIPATLKGLQNLSIKESDRIKSIQAELEKLPVSVQTFSDEIKITPRDGIIPSSVSFSVHNDHRMAMSLAPLAMVIDRVVLDDERVVEKSYPEFWEDLQQAGFEISL